MENSFDSDDDFGDMFITQSSNNGNVVSLEDNDEEKGIPEAHYSDISDFEDDAMENRLR